MVVCFENLPNELLSRIFTITCESFNSEGYRDNSREIESASSLIYQDNTMSSPRQMKQNVKLLSVVCRRWFNIIQMASNGHLWITTLSLHIFSGDTQHPFGVDFRLHHRLAIFRDLIRSSSGSDIDVYWYQASYAYPATTFTVESIEVRVMLHGLSLLVQYARQIRSFAAMIDNWPTFYCALAFINSLATASRLESLHLIGPTTASDIRSLPQIQEVPTLEYYDFIGSPKRLDGRAFMANLVCLEICGLDIWEYTDFPESLRYLTFVGGKPAQAASWNLFKSCMQRCQQLVYLSIFVGNEHVAGAPSEPVASDEKILATSLMHLKLWGSSHLQSAFLSTFMMPRLNRIECGVTSGPAVDDPLRTESITFEQVKELVYSTHMPNGTLHGLPHCFPNLHSATVDMHEPASNFNESIPSQANWNTLAHLYLTTSYPDGWKNAMRYMNLQSVENLKLHGLHFSSDHHADRFHLPVLKSLELDIDVDAQLTFLSLMDTPLLRKLSLRPPFVTESVHQVERIAMPLPQITRLSISASKYPVSFLALFPRVTHLVLRVTNIDFIDVLLSRYTCGPESESGEDVVIFSQLEVLEIQLEDKEAASDNNQEDITARLPAINEGRVSLREVWLNEGDKKLRLE